MCGIGGALHFNGEPVSPVIIGRMADALAHRGPDDQGVYVDGAFGVGHRRLAILDLSSAGHQPMVTPDGRFVLSYNGELYNFAELRAELEAAGWRFRSRTDSEVVLYALVEWGVAALQRFNGMFALALWDKTSRELLLARDRYGIKPLYYATDDKRVLFASEIKALYAHPGFCPGIDMAGLREYMSFQNFISDRTLFDGVNMLEAGTWYRITAGGATRRERYWDFSFEEPREAADEAALHEELLRLFRQAVQRQLVSDVPLGAYLSGGVDSGSVTAIAAAQIPNLTTFTVGFDLNSASGLELGFDERPASEYMSYVLQTEHYEMVLKAGDMERCMRSLVWHLEEPRVGQSYPNYYAARLASRFNKVVLSGTGGDELFGGYPWRYYRAAVNDDFDHYVDKYYGFWQRLLSDDVALDVMAPVAGSVRDVVPRTIFRNVFANHHDQLSRPEDYINHSLYFEAKTFLHGLLVVEDKLSMAHSLESRVPFLDNDLVDFAGRLPVSMKLGNLGEVVRLNENEPGDKTRKYFEKTQDGKRALRSVMKQLIPERIATAVKQGFSAPDASWFRGESIEYVNDRLLTPTAKIYDLFDYKTTASLVNSHLSGRQNRRLLLWSLLYLEQWLEQFMTAGHGRVRSAGSDTNAAAGGAP